MIAGRLNSSNCWLKISIRSPGSAGFDPTSATDNWHALPTHTLRFAEVLAKIYASKFSIGELVYLFTADAHLDGDDPFPLQDANEALDLPLGLPDDERKHSLWHLRQAMMAVEVQEDDVRDWHWKRIEAALQDEFGYTSSDIVAFGWHFFPGVLEQAGYQVSATATRFVSSLAAASTSPANLEHAGGWAVPVRSGRAAICRPACRSSIAR